jgi:hypothetical protein
MTTSAPTAEQVALVQLLLPADAIKPEEEGGYGWDEAYISELMATNGFTATESVRYFWLQRVNETVEYLDVGKPLTQIHKQARDMLAYWDEILKRYGVDSIGPPGYGDTGMPRKPISFGEIERPYE